MKERIVLAYSGGLDTSVLVKWLQQKYHFDVITVTVDVGQQTDLKAVERKAENLGAKNHYSVNAVEEFTVHHVFPAIKANALYEGKYPISTALSRPLIASKIVEVAKKENAVAVAHGCTGKGNDQVRFEVTIKSLAPHLKILAPVREWRLTRDEELKFAKANGIQIPHLADPYSIDQNLWGRSVECGPLEEAFQEPPEEVFEWTTPPEKAPDKPEYVDVQFEEGVPVSINGDGQNPASLIKQLNEIAGKHGVGRIDHIEDRLIGIKSREVYECPAATVLLEGHKDLEKMVLTRHEVLFKQQLEAQWTLLVYTGLWMDPLREDLEAFINKTQERVSGKTRIKLYKGGLRVVGRSSTKSLYDKNLATYDVQTTFNQSYAEGFIDLWGLQTRTYNVLKMMEKTSNKSKTRDHTKSHSFS